MALKDKTIGLFCRQAVPFANIRSMEQDLNMREYMGNVFHGRLYSCDPTHIIQIGAGGTGGYTAVEIMRYLSNMPESIRPLVTYTLIDGDVFEPKNLTRQMCTAEDMGINKATALINNYGPFFQLHPEAAKAVPKYINDASDLDAIITDLEYRVSNMWSRDTLFLHTMFDASGSNYIIIDCVDKNTPRAILYDYINIYLKARIRKGSIYLISSGNGKTSGQVCWGRIQNDLSNLCVGFSDTARYCMQYGNVVKIGVSTIYELEDAGVNTDIINPSVKLPELIKLRSYIEGIFARGVESTVYSSPGIDLQVVANTRLPIISLGAGNSPYRVASVLRDLGAFENDKTFLGYIADLKLPYERFPQLIDIRVDEEEEQMSCAERAIANVQSLYANKTASCLVVNYLTSILSMMFPVDADKPVPISSCCTFFDCAKCSYEPVPITLGDCKLNKLAPVSDHSM